MTGGPAVGVPTSTTFELPGYTVEATLGLSWGLIVRSVGLTKMPSSGSGSTPPTSATAWPRSSPTAPPPPSGPPEPRPGVDSGDGGA